MNLVSLLILPAVIKMQHHTGARYAVAAAALVVLLVAIAFSKRSTTDMGESVAAAASQQGVHDGDSAVKLAVNAIDRWIYDLGDEEHDLRSQLRDAKSQLTS